MSLFLLPDPLQRLAELSTTLWSCQVTLPKDAANPPNLKTAKDQGDQTQLDVTPLAFDLVGKIVLDCGIVDLLRAVETP